MHTSGRHSCVLGADLTLRHLDYASQPEAECPQSHTCLSLSLSLSLTIAHSPSVSVPLHPSVSLYVSHPSKLPRFTLGSLLINPGLPEDRLRS